MTSSVLDRFRQLRQDLHEYGGDERLQWLEEMSHQVPMISSATLQNFSEILELLRTGRRLEPSPADVEAALNRGLEKRAPFHLNKNATADALMIELYGAALRQAEYQNDLHCFVTSNHLDFSTPTGDRREPHPDLAAFFDGPCSGYFYGVEGLTLPSLEILAPSSPTRPNRPNWSTRSPERWPKYSRLRSSSSTRSGTCDG